VVPALSDALRTACAPLPPLVLLPAEQLDMRPALLRNRALSELVHKECTARHRKLVQAVGAKVIEVEPLP
jgi:hypothetical protein